MKKHKKKRYWPLLIIALIVGGLLAVRGESETNPYFYKEGTAKMAYEGFIYPLSYREIWQEVTLGITKLGTFKDGELYALELEQPEVTDPEDGITMGRRYLGYFYVTDTEIYRIQVATYEGFTDEQTEHIIETLRENEKNVTTLGHIVCNEEGAEDAIDENGYHNGIRVDGNRRSYYYYNEDTSATKDYEEIVWEKGKGIVYYKRGSGSMNMHVEFGVGLEECRVNAPEENCQIYYLLNIDGMKGLGHTAFILVDEDGSAKVYSYNGMQYDLLQCLLGKSGIGKMKSFPLTEEEMSDFLATGDLVVSDVSECDNFDRALYRNITVEEYQIIEREVQYYIEAGNQFEALYAAVVNEQEGAEEQMEAFMEKQPPLYNIYNSNCDVVARESIAFADSEMKNYNEMSEHITPCANYVGMCEFFSEEWTSLTLGEDTKTERFLWNLQR